MSSPTLPPQCWPRGRIIAWIIGGLLLIIIVATAWVGLRGAMAYQHLQQIQNGAGAAVSAVAADPSGATSDVARLASDAEAAHGLTSDPVWAVARAHALDRASVDGFRNRRISVGRPAEWSAPPLATASQSSSIDSLKPVNGRIETGALSALVAPAEDAAATAGRAAAAVQAIDRTPLLGAVAAPSVKRTNSSHERRALSMLCRERPNFFRRCSVKMDPASTCFSCRTTQNGVHSAASPARRFCFAPTRAPSHSLTRAPPPRCRAASRTPLCSYLTTSRRSTRRALPVLPQSDPDSRLHNRWSSGARHVQEADGHRRCWRDRRGPGRAFLSPAGIGPVTLGGWATVDS